MKPEPIDFREKIKIVAEAKTDDFITLVKLSGYDPATDFQYRDLNDADFSGCDLSGFDLRGSRITEANFRRAKISGAIFDGRQKRLRSLRAATDFLKITSDKDIIKERIFYICINGDYGSLQKLLLEGFDPNTKLQSHGNTALMIASRCGHFELVKLLLTSNADVNIFTDGDQKTALTEAARNGFIEIVKLLVNAGANIDHRAYENGITALTEAVLNNRIDITKYLIEKCSSLPVTTTDGIHSLIVSHRGTNDQLIKIGTSREKDNTYVKFRKNTSLIMFCCILGYNEILKFLLERNSFNYIDEMSDALIEAVIANELKACEYLLEKEADVNLDDKIYGTPLLISISNNNYGIAKLFLNSGANPNYSRKNKGTTPLIHAIRIGHNKIVDLLLKNGAEANQQSTQGETPLIAACDVGNLAIVKRLIDLRIDLNYCSSRMYKCNGLIVAILEKRYKIVEILLQNGANVNIQKTNDSTTPLMEATKMGNVRLVKLLLAYKANPNIKIQQGDTALKYAKEFNNKKLEHFLEKAEKDWIVV